MNKKTLGVTFALGAVMALTACGGPSGQKQPISLEEIEKAHPSIIKNEGNPVDDAVLKVAVITDNGFKGMFQPFFSENTDDGVFMQHTMGGAFWSDEGLKILMDSDEAPINVHLDKDEMTLTYKINPKFKWNDGSVVSTDDIIKTYEICANPKFIEATQSARYSPSKMNIIKGMAEYAAGEADHISGLEKISDSEMKIHFSEINPGVLYGGSTIGEFVQAKSIEGVPMDQLMECDAWRNNPPSYGPYYMSDITMGENVTFTANPYYLRGEPKVKTLEFQCVSGTQQMADMEAGKHDIYLSPKKEAFSQMAELPNVKIASRPARSLNYLGFKCGHWDAENGCVVTDPKAKMNNVNLKKAMRMALDMDTVGLKYSEGLSFSANSPLSPATPKYHDPNIKGIQYNPEEAKKLLDEAGYKDIDGDGFRETPDKQPLSINFAVTNSDSDSADLAQYYIQNWEAIGLKVNMLDGRPLDFNTIIERLTNDDPDIDIFTMGWSLGSDPDQINLWGKYTIFNDGRFTTPELQDALEACGSVEAMDETYEIQAYHNFEKIFYEQVPGAPLNHTVEILPVNNRVKYYDFSYYSPDYWDWSMLELTAEKPIAK